MSFYVVRVAVPVPLRRSFDYLPCEGSQRADWQAGQRVRVQFGQQLLTAIVLSTEEQTDVPANKLKPLLERLDEYPLLSAEQLQLGQWLSRYYHHSIGEVLELMLPAMLRRGSSLDEALEDGWQRRPDQPSMPTLRGSQQQALWQRFEQQANWSHSALTQQGFSLAQLRRLAELELIEATRSLPVPATTDDSKPPLPLNPEQQKALDALLPELGRFRIALLEGVTGSGKTEVYLQLIAEALQRGQQVMVLVPEIGLTPQTVQRFRERFGVPVVAVHSGLNDRERLQAWCLCHEGRARILIGTRSAVFTPMPQLGLIVLDEEHDNSFKQQDGVRYSARDFALVRAQKAAIPILLGSATPALETLNNALSGRYLHLKLTQRAGNAKPPGMKLHSTLHQPLTFGLAQPVIAKIQQHVEAGRQVLVFINRRGYAPLFACPDCGWLAECRRCDARLTLHQSPLRLHCHHCDYQQGVPGFCPQCHSDKVTALGQGTERLADDLARMFPDVPVTRIDRDTARTRNAFEELLAEVHQPGKRILVGTQMLAKGHHFPSVTMVVILDADAGLFSADFRGMEQTAQLILQVAGRAGRAEHPGEVWIQTLYADHPQLNLLINDGYHALAETLLKERLYQQLPPYSHMAMLRAESPNKALAEQLLQQARQYLQQISPPPQASGGLAPLVLVGPFPAIMERRAGRFRQQLQMFCAERAGLHSKLDPLVDFLHSLKGFHQVRWHLDIDPVDTL
ncbi:primosomal protein N' [Oceanobacter mangrovi]|uniref:primosomal protein N' n=1 Tax=Oceanobacter mangrovi TaxID=2862510 RepID=UPI001C8D6999|nr:primosomal protein N' [Oceanobacter mangrovi]